MLLLLAALAALAACANIADGESFTCAGLSSTPLAGNAAAVARIQAACAADPECAALYAPEDLASPSVFAVLLQLVAPHASPLTLESPVDEILCGADLDTVVDRMWARSLVVGARRLQVCAPDEQLELQAGGTSAACVAELLPSYNNPANFYGYNTGLLAAIAGLLAGLVGIHAWGYVRPYL